MALFKILRGNSSKLFNSSGGISNTVPFNDGYCYFTPDNKKFYIDWLDESKGQHRDPLNSFLADKLLSSWTDVNKVQHTGSAKLVGFTDGAATINNSNEEIPTSAVLYAKFSDVEDTLAALDNDKMDKVNPTGTGYFSLNRKMDYTPGTNSVAVGTQTTASGDSSFAEGYFTTASGVGSHAEGISTTASEGCSHAEGGTTTASGEGSHAEGGNTTASGEGSHAEGGYTVASGQGSHAEGGYTTASEVGSHAEGGYTIASGLCSHSEGWNTTANHKAQHTEGEYNIVDPSTAAANARGTYVHIVGNGTSDTARSNALTLTWGGDLWHSGRLSHGNKVSAEGTYSYAGGSETSAQGNYSHAEGIKTVAQGASSHTEGENTSAIGTASHAEGLSSIAQGYYSHAQNQGTLANGNAQTAIGKFNVADTTSAFIIGNGADASHRSNMFFIDWSGNACFLNTLLVGDNATAPNKITNTKFYVEGISYFNGNITASGIGQVGNTFTIKNANGGDSTLIFDRSNNANWKVLDSGGNLFFQCDWTSGKGSYFNVLKLAYGTKQATFFGNVLPNGNAALTLGKSSNKWKTLYVGDNTDANSTSTGVIQATGGIGVSKSGYFGGDVTADKLHITNTSGVGHITFARGNYNYIQAKTAGGIIAFVVNGQSVDYRTSEMVISDGEIFPGTTAVTNLGSTSNRWKGIYSGIGDFSGNLTVGGTAVIGNGAGSTDMTTGALKVTGGVGISKQLNAKTVRIDNSVYFQYNDTDKSLDIIFG